MTNPQPSQNVAGQPAKAAGEYKPLTTFTIAAANVTQRPLRSLLLGLIAAVFTFLLFSSAMVTANLEAGISSLAARMGADVLVVPQGQGKKIQSVILRAEPSTFYLDGKLLDVVQKLPGVAKASGQLFISSLDAQCCSVKVQLIGIDEATDFVIAPWLKHAADKPLSGNDVIVGDYIYGEIGSTLKFFDQEYRIVGRLAPTGMGFDSSIFMTLDAARRAGRAASPDRADEMAQSLSAILVRVNPGVDPITVSDELLDQLGLKANVNFVFASNMMSDTSAKLQKVVSVMYTAAGGFLAAAAIIMLIFRDSILGLVAGVQLSANDMLRPGDWITMAKYGADGYVTEVTLTTVKVQNFDKTITTIPPYALVSDSFQNWRGMWDSGGRRIKRSVFIDARTIRRCTPEETARLREKGYLAADTSQEIVNLQALREYLANYLRNCPDVRSDLMLMVRTLQPTSEGVPLEFYCFTRHFEWIPYEAFQSALTDRVLTLLPEFGLQAFQRPAGTDLHERH